jgi:hypothetical protein
MGPKQRGPPFGGYPQRRSTAAKGEAHPRVTHVGPASGAKDAPGFVERPLLIDQAAQHERKEDPVDRPGGDLREMGGRTKQESNLGICPHAPPSQIQIRCVGFDRIDSPLRADPPE